MKNKDDKNGDLSKKFETGLLIRREFENLNEDLKSMIIPLLEFTINTDYFSVIEFLIPHGAVEMKIDPHKIRELGFKHVNVVINRRANPLHEVIESYNVTLKW